MSLEKVPKRMVESQAAWDERIGYPWQPCERQPPKAPSHCKNSGTKILTTNLPEHREGEQGAANIKICRASTKRAKWFDLKSRTVNRKAPEQIPRPPPPPTTHYVKDRLPALSCV